MSNILFQRNPRNQRQSIQSCRVGSYPTRFSINYNKSTSLKYRKVAPGFIKIERAPGAPYGDIEWINEATKKLGLQITLRPRGRPKKVPDTF